MPRPLPTVTALVAAYNYANFIGRTLDSALGQDYPAELLDIVIVDDGSTDATPEVLADYECRHPGRVTVIRQENAGYIAATNRGVAEARGEILAILDADDLWPAHKTARQVQCLLDNPEVGLVYSDTEIIDPYDAVRRTSFWEWLRMTPQRGPDCFVDIMSKPGNVALASTIMLRRDLAHHAFPMPLRAPYVDWWVTARIAGVASIDWLKDVKVGYRQHGDNLTLGATGMRQVRESLKCAESRRQLLIHGASGHLTDPQVLDAWRSWEGAALTAVQQAGSAFIPVAAIGEDERAQSVDHAEVAHRATLSGDIRTAFRERINAVACDPYDGVSREWIHDLAWVAALGDGPRVKADPLADARRFVTLAYAEELAAEPELLGAYASILSDADDATLAVAAVELGDQRAVNLISVAAQRVGLHLAELPDVLLITSGGPAARIELERGAHAVLTRRPPRLAAPGFRPDNIDALKILATA